MTQYLGIFVLLVLSILFAGGSLMLPALLAPSRPTAAKRAPYECGIVPTHGPAQRFPVRFYLVAMIFIIFDIEVVFLYPWAVVYGRLGTFGLIEMGLFALSVVVAFVYLVSNGALDWGPTKRLVERGVPEGRTTESAVTRVPSSRKAA
ncbi:MAG: NADH-quinone oxidoreductase subunit A [Actinomycetota bacterium]|nr:NADH-quinone oxidoreductase subunit A [Actinomycetota bacterium]